MANLGSKMPYPDYQNLIDRQTWDFIRATEATYPADSASLTIPDQRRIYDRMCRMFHQGHPPGVAVRDAPVATIPCRHYTANSAQTRIIMLYLHGGGFVVGGLHSHDDICAELCAQTGLAVVSVDYRLCPEHPHPAAYDDCLAVARALPGPMLLVGDSAGGALAACLAAQLPADRVLGQVLIYPGLGGHGESYRRHAHAPMLSAADVNFYAALRGADPTDPTAYALAVTDFASLPPTLAISAECDPLADDAAEYAGRITAAGGRAHAITEPGLVHGFLRARATVPRAAASFARITATLSAFAKGDWPYGESA